MKAFPGKSQKSLNPLLSLFHFTSVNCKPKEQRTDFHHFLILQPLFSLSRLEYLKPPWKGSLQSNIYCEFHPISTMFLSLNMWVPLKFSNYRSRAFPYSIKGPMALEFSNDAKAISLEYNLLETQIYSKMKGHGACPCFCNKGFFCMPTL